MSATNKQDENGKAAEGGVIARHFRNRAYGGGDFLEKVDHPSKRERPAAAEPAQDKEAPQRGR